MAEFQTVVDVEKRFFDLNTSLELPQSDWIHSDGQQFRYDLISFMNYSIIN